jgi:hypothetical protein
MLDGRVADEPAPPEDAGALALAHTT